MKKQLLLKNGLIFLAIMLLGIQTTFGQSVTINTGLTGNTSAGTGLTAYITFAIRNNSGIPIKLQKVGNWASSADGAYTLYYSSTALSGAVDLSNASLWSAIPATASVIPSATYSIQEVLNNVNFIIPANTTYRFAVQKASGTNYYTTGGGNTFTSGGVSMYINDYQISGMNVGYGGGNNPRSFCGFVTYEPVPQGPNNASISKLETPVVPFCAGNYDVKVRLKNSGTNILSNVNINWTLDGVSQAPVAWTSPLDTLGGTLYPNDTAITLATSVPFTAARTLKVWTDMPNSVADTSNADDTILVNLAPAINGNFTIGGTSPDYADVQAAVSSLKASGVCGPVHFTVRPGTYSGQVDLTGIAGVSATNTITFEGVDKATSIITHTYVAGSYATLTVGVPYVTLRNLTINAVHANTGFGVLISNNSHYCKIINCNVNVPLVSSTASAGIAVSGSSTSPTTAARADYVEIDSVTVTGGYYSIVTYGASGTGISNGFKLTNSKLLNYYYNGAYLYYNNSVYIHNNTITATTAVQTGNGIYFSQLGHTGGIANIITNNILTNQGYYGIYFATAANPSTTNKGVLVNNVIGGPSTSAVNYYGIYMSAGTNWRVAHNTSHFTVPNATITYVPAYFTGGSAITCVNNIFRTLSGGYTFYGSAATIFDTLNYNTYSKDVKGTNYFYLGAAYTDVTMVGAGSRNTNIITADPEFTTATSLIPKNTCLTGTSLPSVTMDVTGAARSLTAPTHGAYEVTPVLLDAKVEKLTQPTTLSLIGLQDATVLIRNAGTTTLTSVDVTIKVNSHAPVTVAWSGSLNQCDTASVLFNFGNQIQFDSSSKIVIYTSNPNFSTDLNKGNDTLKVDMFAPMSGTYTVGGPGANFVDVVEAVTILKKAGVAGPVMFNINPGTYSGQVLLNAVPGVSATNTVTFAGADKATTIITHSFTTGEYATWVTENLSYVTLRNLTINATHSNNAWGIRMNNAHNNKIINCNVNVPSINSTTAMGIVVSGSSTSYSTAGRADSLEIDSVTINGGYMSLSIYGGSASISLGTKLSNSKLLNYYYNGAYFYYTSSMYIHGNTITPDMTAGLQTGNGIYFSQLGNAGGVANVITNNTLTNQGYYGIYFATATNPSVANKGRLINNIIGGPTNSPLVYYGIYMSSGSNWQVAHNTSFYSVTNPTLTYVPAYFTGGSGIACFNNIFRTNSVGYTFYGSAATIFDTLDYNVYSKDVKGANYFYLGSALTDVTLIGSGSRNTNAKTLNPAFMNEASGNLIPLSSNIDNMGIPVPTITTDITGALRSNTTPDPGVYEFTGIAGDMQIVGASLKRASSCYSMNDTIAITVQNLLGSTVDFSIDPLTVNWSITGPVASSGSTTINTGTLTVGSNLNLLLPDANRSSAGNYTLKVYLSSNAVNISAVNDTLQNIVSEVKPILSVTPKTATVTSSADTVVLLAGSPLFPGGGIFISEICHFKTTVGQPAAGWPAYLLADDYVELTGVPNSDLAGYTMEEWTATGISHTVTFPSGTLFSPTGTMVIATGQLGTSVPVPASFYYHSGNTLTHGSTVVMGYILKNPSGTIIDAVVYGTMTFPAASGVTATDWTGSTPAASSSGNRMSTPDNNTNTCWINSGTTPQDPNVLNAGLTAPLPGTLTGFDWNYLGSSISTSPRVVVGPYTTPGVYVYVASYTNACGTFYDTVYVTASSTVPVTLTSFTAIKENANVNLNWNTASEVNNSHFEIERSENGRDFKTIGRVKGNGTTSRPNRYAFVDENAARTGASTLYYRLKQVDNDGTSTYSRTAVVTLSDKRLSGLSTYPNPSNGVFTIGAELESTSSATIKVVNVMGKTVWNQVVNPVLGANVFDAHMQLPNGVYMLLFEQDGATSTQKFVIE